MNPVCMVEPDHHVWSEMASQLFSPFIHLIKMNVKTGTVRWMPRLSLDSLNKSRSAPELPNHWCCKPCLLSVLRFDSTRKLRKPYYEEASGAVEAMFIAKSTFMWQASVGRHSKAVQWGSYVFLQKNQPVFQKFRWTEYVNIKMSGLPNSPRNPFRPLEAEQVVILSLSCLPCESLHCVSCFWSLI